MAVLIADMVRRLHDELIHRILSNNSVILFELTFLANPSTAIGVQIVFIFQLQLDKE